MKVSTIRCRRPDRKRRIKTWPIFVLISWVFFIVGAQPACAETLSICDLDQRLVEDRLVPALESGLSKTLAVAKSCGAERMIIGSVSVRKNLWRKIHTLTHSDGRMESFTEPADFRNGICEAMRVVDDEPCPGFSGGGEVLVFLNPANQAVDKVMRDWIDKNAGIYRSLGMRIRWSSLRGSDRFERLLYRGRRGGK